MNSKSLDSVEIILESPSDNIDENRTSTAQQEHTSSDGNETYVDPNIYIDSCGAIYSSDRTVLIKGVDSPNFIINANVKKIGDSAFYGFKNLKTLILPKDLTEIGNKAFYRCSNLNIRIQTKGILPFSQGVISSPILLVAHVNAYAIDNRLNKIRLPDSIVQVGDMAFYECSGIISIELPNTPIKIGSKAFPNNVNIIYRD